MRGTERGPLIGSLAVDVEPVVFWTGTDPSASAELERWELAVGFSHDDHGQVAAGNNGPSGAGLVKNFLNPLGIDRSSPCGIYRRRSVVFVQSGKGSQGEAITSRSAQWRKVLEYTLVHRRLRPSCNQLVGIASSERRRDSLRREILDSGAPLVITLGQEALGALLAVADEAAGVQTELSPSGYGQVGHIVVDHQRKKSDATGAPELLRQDH